MTMTRNTKRDELRTVQTVDADGYTAEQFASPKLRAQARADRGHCRMTRAEYATHRMSRGAMPTSRIDLAIEMRGIRIRQQRVLGGHRVTGVQPGTKRPTSWTSHSVEREVRRAG